MRPPRRRLLLTQETRLSRTLANGNSWVTGFTLLRNSDAQNRALGAVAAPADIIGVTNVTKSASVFAEGTARLLPAFALTLGARVTIARTDGEPSFKPRVNDYVEGRSTGASTRPSPSRGSWRRRCPPSAVRRPAIAPAAWPSRAGSAGSPTSSPTRSRSANWASAGCAAARPGCR